MNRNFTTSSASALARKVRGGTLLLFFLTPTLLTAQTWNEDFLNQPRNIQYEGSNPCRIAYNTTRDFAVANINYQMAKGDLRAIHQSSDERNIKAYIGGLRHIGKFDVQGHLSYQHLADMKQSWGNSLWNNPLNPYVFCDSVPGDATTEAFDLHATATYPFTDRLRAGLSLGLKTGTRADQSDPRPRTTSSLLPISAGLEYVIADAWHVGLSGGVRFFSSIVEYSNVQPLINHRYFLMKGMGDYIPRSTGDDSGYKRDYSGFTGHGQLQLSWQPKGGHWADFLEAGYRSSSEDATDGGTAYTFHGGDYSETELSVQNRLQFAPNDSTLHSLRLSFSTMSGQGFWYEQKRETDFEHGNIQYYRILAKNINHKNAVLNFGLSYQLDFLREGKRDLYFLLKGEMNSLTRKQYLGSNTPKQEINLLRLNLQAGKHLSIRRVALLLQLGGGYVHPLTKKFATGSSYQDANDITDVYVRRIFNYEAASYAHVDGLVDVSMPVSKKLNVGVYAHADYRFFTGSDADWQDAVKPKRTWAQFGAYLKF